MAGQRGEALGCGRFCGASVVRISTVGESEEEARIRAAVALGGRRAWVVRACAASGGAARCAGGSAVAEPRRSARGAL